MQADRGPRRPAGPSLIHVTPLLDATRVASDYSNSTNYRNLDAWKGVVAVITEKTASDIDLTENPAGDLGAELDQLFALSEEETGYTTITVPTTHILDINCCE